MSSNAEEVHISSHLFGLLFPKIVTGTPQLMLDMMTSRARAAVRTLQSRYKRGLYNDEYEMDWLMRMAVELEAGASLLGRSACANSYLYISPFYKSLSALLRPGLPHPLPTEIRNVLGQLDSETLPGWPSGVVEQYWDPWWIPGMGPCAWNWKTALNLFITQVPSSSARYFHPTSSSLDRLRSDVELSRFLLAFMQESLASSTLKLYKDLRGDVGVLDVIENGGILPALPLSDE